MAMTDDMIRDRFDKIDEDNKQQTTTLGLIDKKLFHDNGGKCIQSKLNDHDRFIREHDTRTSTYNKRLWMICFICIAQVVGLALWAIKSVI